MGFFSSLFQEREELGGLEGPTPEPADDRGPDSKSTTEQAKLFIRTINTTRIFVDAQFIGIFDRNVVSHAVNLAKQGEREGWERTQDNYFVNKAKYMAIVGYLRGTDGQG